MTTSYTKIKKLTATLGLALGLSFSFSSQAATEIMLAYGNQPGEPIDLAMHYWADQVKERSNGEIVFQLFPSSQLGSETEVLEQAKFGANIIAIASYGYLMDTVPDFGIVNAPYITQSFEKKSKLMQTDWFKGLEGQLADKGLQMVVPDVVYGTRHLLSNKKVVSPADLKGVKVRVQHSRSMVATVKAMGGVPTPMSLADVYPGLSQGVIDGVENPAVVLYGGKFHEVAKHLSLTGHIKMLSPFVAGTAYWNQLSEEQRQIITETSRDMVKYGAKLIDELEKEAFANLKAEGVEVNEVDVKAFSDAVGEVIQDSFPEWSPNLYKDTQAKLEKL